MFVKKTTKYQVSMKTFLSIFYVLSALNITWSQSNYAALNFNANLEVNRAYTLSNNSTNLSLNKPKKLNLGLNTINRTKNTFESLTMNDEYGKGKSAAINSLFVPGLGLYQANQSKLSLALAPICYGLVGTGAFLMLSGKNNAEAAYANYLSEKNPKLQDQYFDEAEEAVQSNFTGLKLVASGAAIWIGQVIWTYIYGSYNDQYRARDSKWTDSLSGLYGGYDFNNNATTINLTLKI